MAVILFGSANVTAETPKKFQAFGLLADRCLAVLLGVALGHLTAFPKRVALISDGKQ